MVFVMSLNGDPLGKFRCAFPISLRFPNSLRDKECRANKLGIANTYDMPISGRGKVPAAFPGRGQNRNLRNPIRNQPGRERNLRSGDQNRNYNIDGERSRRIRGASQT